MLRLSIVSVVALSLVGFIQAQSTAAPDSIARLIDLEGLPQLLPGVTCRQFASTDPSGRGDDHGHFLRLDGKRAVLAEMDGPGVIARLWSANASGRLRVFIDGEAEPRIDGPFQDLFTGKLPPFVEPIAIHASGGWISYFPIPYAKSCRVEVDELENPGSLYYQVQYLTYPAGTPMRSFTPELPRDEQRARDAVQAIWRDPGASPIAARDGDRQPSMAATIPPRGTQELFATGEPGTIVELHIGVDDTTGDALRGLQLIASWDGGEPSIAVPLGDFFGVGFGATPYRGLALGWDEHGGYCHLPMPFHRSARIELRNLGENDQTVHVALRWRPSAPPSDFGALHAEFRAIDGVGEPLYEFASIDGPGKFIGIQQALQGVGDLWYLEGNEEFFVDGEREPSILGTGTEDFYNGGWYWDRGTFALPLHGLGVKAEWTSNRTTPWRMLVPDAVPFTERLVARIEHGSSNAVRDAYYSSVAFWYGPPRAVRAIPATETRLPRLWVFRPKGFVGAASLQWEPAPLWRTWEQATATHRGLDRPLYQGFPVSYVERDQPALDARIAVFDGATDAGIWRAHFETPFADRFRLQLRLFSNNALPGLSVDGRALVVPANRGEPWIPMQIDVDAGALTAGRHELAFRIAPTARGKTGLDSLRVVPGSPFVHTWRIAPPIPARKDGTVADAMACEAVFLAADFDPAAAGWKVVNSGDSVDLNGQVSSQSPMLAYLMVFVHSPNEREAHVLLGSDDGARVWVNSALQWSHEIHRHLTADEDGFDVPLRAGWNRLLVKVKNDYGGYGLMLRIADVDGALRFAADPR